ncbi:hypothetical protein H5410_040220 [Solanum commersonii]|uniref:Serine-threonine/tyrosine-protein kinase catalytic domain-containing protein n=1 Tax=Solanum commersonii TaxID=4109 RepID=A0A9J5XPG9_SOLCO|nr:hypothetical protein H5410_040220 [Solanum commersonii]
MSRLIEECWNPDSFIRPTFSEIIVRLNKIVANCSKHGWLKDTLKLPWDHTLDEFLDAGYRVKQTTLTMDKA